MGRIKVRATQWSMVLVAAAILVVVNLLASGTALRLDMTEDKIYTPSDSTRTLLTELDDDILIRGYFTPNLPPPYNRVERQLVDLLDEYRSLSGGKLRYEIIDPGADLKEGESAETVMAMQGIPMVQVTEVASDQVQVKNGFMALVVMFEDQQEVIPVVQSTAGLEFLLTSKIRKVTDSGRKVVGVLEGYDAPVRDKEMARVMGAVAEQYDIQGVDLEAGDLPSNLDLLLVIGPTLPLSDWALSRIDRYLAQGGSVGIFASGVKADLTNVVAYDLPPLFGKLPQAQGWKIGRDLVADPQNMRITVAQQRGMFTLQNLVDYPFFPLVRELNDEQVMVSGLEQVYLPFVSTVTATAPEGVNYTVLAKSTARSWQLSGSYAISPLVKMEPHILARNANGPQPLIVAGEGTFPSAYEGDSVLPPNDAPAETVTIDNPAPGRLLLVGSGQLFSDQYLLNGESVPFLLNAIDWLARDEVLIGLRSRGVTDRPLEELSDLGRQLTKLVNLLGGAVLLIGFGLIRWRLRRAKRLRLGLVPRKGAA